MLAFLSFYFGMQGPLFSGFSPFRQHEHAPKAKALLRLRPSRRLRRKLAGTFSSPVDPSRLTSRTPVHMPNHGISPANQASTIPRRKAAQAGA